MAAQPVAIHGGREHYSYIKIYNNTGYLDLDRNELKNALLHSLDQTGINALTKSEAQLFYNTTTHKHGGRNNTADVYFMVEGSTYASTIISDFTEAAQDAIGTILTNSDTIDFVYTDGTPSITAVVKLATSSGLSLTSGLNIPVQAGLSAAAYTKVTVNTQGIITAAGAIEASDLPSHNSTHYGIKLSDFAVPTTDVSFNNVKITSLADPVNAQDAVNLRTLQAAQTGLSPKQVCRAISVSNISLSGAQTIDTVSIVAGDRVLVTGQSTQSQNGIYVASASSWARSTDADSWAELIGANLFISEGSASYAETGWVCTVDAGGTLGSTAVTWVQFTGAGTIVAGDGLDKTGNTLSVKTDSSATTWIDSDVVKVKLAASGGIVTAGAGIYVDCDGTTIGLSSGKVALVAGYANKKELYTLTGNGSSTSFTWTHNKGTKDIIWRAYDDTTFADVEPTVVRTSTSAASIQFDFAPANGKVYYFSCI